jgi:hypothetical protein
MNSFRADALRLMRPFLSRAVTLDFREVVVDDFAFVCLIRTVEDDFDDFDDECFCAGRSNGSNKTMISATSEPRLIMRPPNTMELCSALSATAQRMKRKSEELSDGFPEACLRNRDFFLPIPRFSSVRVNSLNHTLRPRGSLCANSPAEVSMQDESFEELTEDVQVITVGAASLHTAERMIVSCEYCLASDAEIPFDSAFMAGKPCRQISRYLCPSIPNRGSSTSFGRPGWNAQGSQSN